MFFTPKNIITTEGVKEINNIKLTSLYDNLEDKVVFRATLLKDNTEVISLDVVLENQKYLEWDSTREDAYKKVIEILNI